MALLIREVVEKSGVAPVSKWLDKHMDAKERAKFHVRLNRLERDDTINPSWLAPYVSLSMWEIRFDQGGKAYRVLCERIGDAVIMLLSPSKNGQITSQEEDRAKGRRTAIFSGEASVRDYPLPERA